MSAPLPAQDTQLKHLAQDRVLLMRQLATVLPRVGVSYGKRRRIVNAGRAALRRTLRVALRTNAEQIAARVMTLYAPERVP